MIFKAQAVGSIEVGDLVVSKGNLLEKRIAARECVSCGGATTGQYAIHEFATYTGREVPLCNACGGESLPTCEEIWERIKDARFIQLVDVARGPARQKGRRS